MEVAFPCETVVWKALPAIKSALAQALVKEGMTQVEVSKLLGTTEATISHYMKGERGSAIILGQHILDELEFIAKRIKAGDLAGQSVTQELCGICNKVRNSCAICGAETLQDCDHCSYI